MPTLEQKQSWLRLKNGEYPDLLAEGKVRLAMWLLIEADPMRDLGKLGRRFGRTKAWTERWVDAQCPLFPYF